MLGRYWKAHKVRLLDRPPGGRPDSGIYSFNNPALFCAWRNTLASPASSAAFTPFATAFRNIVAPLPNLLKVA